MKLIFVLLLLPLTTFAENEDLISSLNSRVQSEVEKECETCTFQIQFQSPLLKSDKTDWQSISHISAPYWKGQTNLTVVTEKQNISFLVNIRWFDKVVVAKNNIRHGSLIDGSDVKVINKDVTFNKASYVNKVAAVVGKVGKRAFRKGQVIDENSIKLPRIVKYGQPIKLLFDQGVLSVTVSGKSKGTGSVGDIIPVTISKTKKKVMAKIIDKTSARIE